MVKGIHNIYKEVGPTSHDVIERLRRITGIKKIGHAGTLDPRAEGVLVVGIGRQATKKLGLIVKKEKEYLAEIKFGYISSTYDIGGKLQKIRVKRKPSREEVIKVLEKFIGNINQKPPIFSAIKIKGRSAYRYARQGVKLTLKLRKVLIKSIKLLDYQWPLLSISVICGPGVYIRSLANDIGENLSVGGYLCKLVRTRVGEYKLEQAKRVVDFV